MSDENQSIACLECGQRAPSKQTGPPCPVCGEPLPNTSEPPRVRLPRVERIEVMGTGHRPTEAPLIAFRAILRTLIQRTEGERTASVPDHEKALSKFEHFARVISLLVELEKHLQTLTTPDLTPRNLRGHVETLSAEIVRAEALRDLMDERRRQDAKFGEQNLDPFIYLSVLMEETGEYAQAVLHTRFGGEKGGLWNMRTEALHTAAVALSIVECLDRKKWGFGVSVDSYTEAVRAGSLELDAAAALADSLASIIGSNDPTHLRRMRAEIQLRGPSYLEPNDDDDRSPVYLAALETLIRYRERKAAEAVESNDNAESGR